MVGCAQKDVKVKKTGKGCTGDDKAKIFGDGAQGRGPTQGS